MKLKIITIADYATIIFSIALIAFGSWQIERWFHWKFSYESLVREEVRKQIQEMKDHDR